MSLFERTRRAVNERLDHLSAGYDGFRVAGDTVELTDEEFALARERAEDGRVGGASACVLDGDRVLLVRTRESAGAWGVPGAAATPGEQLEAAATRAVRDATGVTCTVSDLYQVRRRRTVAADDPDGPTIHSLWAFFDADYDAGTPTPAGDDVTATEWWQSPPDVVHPVVQSRVHEWATDHDRAQRP
ncbi:NUDIX domain-containing protein [Halostella sp. JP-L12]|uniref:NUDIX domain-containing protein n=1 Tax=Halostella TaxID=1843185 RepID=UPI000EF78BFD|nr:MULTISPECIES: NUDIX domain-containing protein [Halostella]NHN47710.1 NUDIX domain-containing protein [Halostella sp. JP-L12]